ncbi:hypothetical protein DVH26_32560 [Paenibacillus sp. H1-7]|uniref:hypothetical protein n=1 Tax=Paenibacillus sp. H1-7 TaxID=2282849 RepID=UPI001EF85B61|nr:hypothetical protein [Paenibacillus sp. H1-7]ULL18755.1 hypothetical protein DVH26_32560 [Paenibacillus sp. H1-7]
MYDIAILSYTGIVIQTVALIGLYFIYRKREHLENGFALKLLGYFMLGCFSFSWNSLSIPLGIAAYLLCFRPVLNPAPKRKAVFVGFLVFLSGFVYHLLPDHYVSSHQVDVPASDSNIYQMNWKSDWNEISRYTGTDAIVQDVRVNFEPDGTLEQLNMNLVRDSNTDHAVYYAITLDPDQSEYRIQYSQTHPKDPRKPSVSTNGGTGPSRPLSVQHVRMASLIQTLTDHSVKDLLPPGQADGDGFGISVDGQLWSSHVPGPSETAFAIDKKKIQPLESGQPVPLPSFYRILFYRMVKDPPQYTKDGSYTVSSRSEQTRHCYVAP